MVHIHNANTELYLLKTKTFFPSNRQAFCTGIKTEAFIQGENKSYIKLTLVKSLWIISLN